MIKVKQVKVENGKCTVTVEYSIGKDVKQLKIDFDEVSDRLRQVSRLLGREATEQDLKDALRAIVKEAREKGEAAKQPFDPLNLVGVDLE